MSHDHLPATASVYIRSDTILSDISVSSTSSSGTSPLSPFISGSSTSSEFTSGTSSVGSDQMRGFIEKQIWLSGSPSPISPFPIDTQTDRTSRGRCTVRSAGGGEEHDTPLADVSLCQTLSRFVLPPAAIPRSHSPEADYEAGISFDLKTTLKVPSGNATCSYDNSSATPESTPADGEDGLIPPANFGVVADGVYRSSFPLKKNFTFLNTLNLKTVLVLVQEDYPEENRLWVQSQNIRFLQFGIPGHKEAPMPPATIEAALLAVLDKNNHPMLIHCNKGKHRTGCLVACLRRLQNWSLEDTITEYCRYSSPKDRIADKEFVSAFELATLRAKLESPIHDKCLPLWMTETHCSATIAKGREIETAEEEDAEFNHVVVDAPP